MPSPSRSLIATLLCLSLSVGGGSARADTGPAEQLRELDHAYAMLHAALNRFRLLDEALLLKLETEAFGQAIQALADLAERFDERLQTLDAQRDDLSLEDQGLPRFELEKRALQIRERSLELGTPLLGKHGAEMEREALLSLSGAINQQRYLLRVMEKAEQRPDLQQWMSQLGEQLDAVHARYQTLLASAHFCAPAD